MLHHPIAVFIFAGLALGATVYYAADEPVASTEQSEPRTVFIEATSYLPCHVFLPETYDPEQTYPLVIALHGYGGNAERFVSIWYAFEDPQFIYAVPQAPYPVVQPEYLGYSWFVEHQELSHLWQQSMEFTQEYALDVVATLQEQYETSSVYLLGFSQGSAVAYTLGISRPDLFAGVISYCGWFEPDWLSDTVISHGAGLRVFIASGTEDHPTITQRSTATGDLLVEQGYDVTFLQFEDSHTLPADALKVTETWIESAS